MVTENDIANLECFDNWKEVEVVRIDLETMTAEVTGIDSDANMTSATVDLETMSLCY